MKEYSIKDAHQAVDFILGNSKAYAQAKGDRIYLEEYRKSLKAILMAKSDAKTAVDREAWAYAHEEYTAHLDGIRAAVEREESLRWALVAAQARIEVLRSSEASARIEMRATQ